MPLIPENIKRGYCPYCMDGELYYDKHSKRVYCNRCNKAVIMEGLK